MTNQFKKILRFAQSTGDKLIVTDPEGNEPMVVMPMQVYAELVGFAGLKRSIKEDVAANIGEEVDALANLPDEFFAPNEPLQDELALDANIGQESTKSDRFKVPEDTAPEPEVVNTPTLAKNEEVESGADEEQFYLEPVE